LVEGYRVLIATNGTVEATDAIMRTLSIEDLVPRECVYISEEYGSLKREGRIHRVIRNRFGNVRMWGVGNRIEDDLIPGAAMGMIPVWVTEFCDPEERVRVPPVGTKVIRSISELPSVLRI
jgi:FMN phosphatase YigB (HAD superfamily)